MELKSDAWNVRYNAENATIVCSGVLDLRGKDAYHEIAELLDKALEDAPPCIILDIRELELLNSDGRSVFGGFVINVRKKGVSRLKIRGSNVYPWQKKNMKVFGKLMPGIEQEFE